MKQNVMNLNESRIQWKLSCLLSTFVFYYSVSALSNIIPVVHDDPRVTRAFADIGDMYEAVGLIWSGVTPQIMNHYDAENYCKDLGGGARLPTKNEWESLAQIMVPQERYTGRYNPDFLPGTKGKWFWSSTIFSSENDMAFMLDGTEGDVGSSYMRFFIPFARCVQGGSQQSAVSTVMTPVPQHDLRVSSAFASLGPMHEAVGLIWSKIASKKMNHNDATQYCQDLGGGARLPSKEEWETLARAMGKGVFKRKYDPDLVPDMSNRSFWSLSTYPALAGDSFVFHSHAGNINHNNNNSRLSVRCVIGVTAQQENVISNSVSSSEHSSRPDPNAIPVVQDDDSRVIPTFAALGIMREAVGLIWSEVAPKIMSQYDAEKYCQGIEEGARLPTKEELEALRKIMSPIGKFNPELFPGTKVKWFWSSSVDQSNATWAFALDGDHGNVSTIPRDVVTSVRCVATANRASRQVPVPVVVQTNPVVRPNSDEIVPVIDGDERVARNFAALGPMHEAVGLIWSHVASQTMNHYDAEKFCHSLGGGARLPTKEEWGVLKRVMSPGGRYNPNLIPGTKNRWFWSSSLYYKDDIAFYFRGDNGDASNFIMSDLRVGSVRCVYSNVAGMESNAKVAQTEKSDTRSIPIQTTFSSDLVTHAFADLGDIYEAVGLIWSGIASQKMSQSDAMRYCQHLGGGARLPTREEWEALAKAMSTGGRYNSDLLPGTKGKWFWSSSDAPDDADFAFNFGGKQGSVAFEERSSVGSVRCVIPVTTSSSPAPKSDLKSKATSALGVFVKIPAGKFLMGSHRTEKDHYDDERQHEVSLSSFEMGETVVTQEVYVMVMGVNPSYHKEAKYCSKMFKQIQAKGVQIPLCPDHPVEQVSWDDAQEFIRLVNHEFYGEGYTYSLPTEAQTEYAIRGGTTTAYVSGADERGLGKYVIYDANSQKQTQPVKSKLPNRFGIYRGGVWEWTLDWYSENYEGSQGLDPKGPSSGSSRVFRGGSWLFTSQDCRSAVRSYDAPDGSGFNLGFRLVRTPH